eukprot:TRINITY_DN39684_c0_g1_i1.p2 TRINITY_DN39684_c0_g1~~TRINITY_DN39684_c0_g1_i1.p2  ORF type:complete len:123 (-),score=14.70 TRINITY_DN39684_c0_g1_i1:264-632(-)
MPPRSCQLMAIRQVRHGTAQLVGSDVHISCGLEMKLWRVCNDQAVAPCTGAVDFSLDVGRRVQRPRLWLYLPGSSEADGAAPTLQGVPEHDLDAERVGEDVWRITLPHLAAQAEKNTWRLQW